MAKRRTRKLPKKRSKKRGGKKDMDRGQMWSADVVIGIVIFVSIIIIFYTTFASNSEDVRTVLKSNADTVLWKFTQDPALNVIDERGILNSTRVEQLSNMTYEQLKSQLGIQNDFCIYIEDENGRILPIGAKSSFGSPNINVSGQPCGSFV